MISHPPRIEVSASSDAASKKLAARIAAAIRHRETEGGHYVLGLATGSTPIPLYRELIRLHREEGLSFRNVIGFNLDEYLGIPADDPNSFRTFMFEQLFDHIDLPVPNIHIPDGTIETGEIESYCAGYEAAIAAAGGIDLQILGIGRSGHIGFNEPPSPADSRTRRVTLDPVTREDAAATFGGLGNVPVEAITMGVGTILEAREIAMMAWGAGKAAIVAKALRETPSPALPASLLQNHGNVTIILDDAAATYLDR
ncbi:glucosamine-6-phosphate deaminase [Luteolibacter marinus]|uniref:glucosamine-6-phosphate deaminase n=1 Tax=Luteolibacter marinus TaxID=2776705 RepID=UPI001D01ECD5|nr:glucosamine-6-phosphate deaminase [Luteolibacter marinus]